MNLQLGGSQLLEGAAGKIEVLVDLPADEAVGIAIVAHPHPKPGGSAQHKIPALLARSLAGAGWIAVRPNFRGVGRSEGTHDEGLGETDDIVALYRELARAAPAQRIALAGFSFGAFVIARTVRRLVDEGTTPWRTVLAGMPSGDAAGGRTYDTPGPIPQALVVHGERDESVPLSQVMDWARAHRQPVTVVPGADHFFAGSVHLLRNLVLEHFRV